MQAGEEFLQWPETAQRMRYCGFVWTGKSGNVSLKSFWQVEWEWDARQCSTMNTHEHSLRLWKLYLHFDCWKTIDGLARAGYNMTWPDWALVQSQRYRVVINLIDLYWTANINRYLKMGSMSFRSHRILQAYTDTCICYLLWWCWALGSHKEEKNYTNHAKDSRDFRNADTPAYSGIGAFRCIENSLRISKELRSLIFKCTEKKRVNWTFIKRNYSASIVNRTVNAASKKAENIMKEQVKFSASKKEGNNLKLCYTNYTSISTVTKCVWGKHIKYHAVRC
jgi:hypothetical protein